MKYSIKNFIWLVILISFGIGVCLFVNSYINHKATKIENPIEVKETFGDNKKLDEIRSRENIKRQQELIVQEVYLTEEKERINREKEEAIAQFDAQIQTVENKLEDVRIEKVSF